MTTLREAATLALEALEAMNPYPASKEDQRNKAITALRTALEQPERKPLTDEQKMKLCKQFPEHLTYRAIEAVEAAHGIKE